MISSINDLQTDQNRNSINISYLRNVNIIFGNYNFPEILNNFIINIKNNLNPQLKNYTNVKGGMTDWNYFVDKPEFIKFINYLINKYQLTHPDIFKYFLERKDIQNAWGNEINKGDKLDYHMHPCAHGILYLTKGCDLILPELNLKISPKPGNYYILPSEILHGFDEYKEENTRYSLVFNIVDKDSKFKIKNYMK